MIAADQVRRQLDGGCGARRGQHVALVDEQHVASNRPCGKRQRNGSAYIQWVAACLLDAADQASAQVSDTAREELSYLAGQRKYTGR